MAWQMPVFDRTSSDLAAGADKCFFSPELLNRIEGNTAYLAALFGLELNTRTWYATDYLTVNQMRRILGNVDALRNAYFTLPGAPELPPLPATLYSDVNAVEELLWGMHELWLRNAAGRCCAGEISAGEQIGVI